MAPIHCGPKCFQGCFLLKENPVSLLFLCGLTDQQSSQHETAVCAWVEIQEGCSIQACRIHEVGVGALSRCSSGASSLSFGER